ncbi:MAG: hypothetical protein JZU47_10880 [Prolixibacteraceae bacterium]|nr:hypothetical protein [Prolixibacteraceae bacterium]
MKIRLTGDIDPELTILGLKQGDELEVIPDPNSKAGCCHFTKYLNGYPFNCSIWPDNYEKINSSLN